jgi:hypothetical protein
MADTISLDALLSDQENPVVSVTIELITDLPELIKVTPWSSTGGCLCHLAVQIKRSSVESVTPTGEVHLCCGKRLKVVDIKFKEGESIALDDLFSQLASRTDDVRNKPLLGRFPIDYMAGRRNALDHYNPEWIPSFTPSRSGPVAEHVPGTLPGNLDRYFACLISCFDDNANAGCRCACRVEYEISNGNRGWRCPSNF